MVSSKHFGTAVSLLYCSLLTSAAIANPWKVWAVDPAPCTHRNSAPDDFLWCDVRSDTANSHGSCETTRGHLQVYDISAEDGAQQSFEFVQSAQYWEVPISGQGPPENPVPAADGSTYQVRSAPAHKPVLQPNPSFT